MSCALTCIYIRFCRSTVAIENIFEKNGTKSNISETAFEIALKQLI